MNCDKQEVPPVFTDKPVLFVPEGFPNPVFPADNAFTLERWELGRRLFYDPILSRDSSISCASCHLAAYAFGDSVAFSPGVADAPGVRNAPTLINVAYHPYFTREGGVPTLEMQVLIPIQEHNEFDFNIVLIAERLQEDLLYVAMSYEAYEREPDHFVISRALATFERTLISGESAYDAYQTDKRPTALTQAQLRGMALFFSDQTNCSDCHGGFNFTNYAFENNGLYADYPDPGRFRLTSDSTDLARFKVPGLRNIALTAPYMHDGSLPDLHSVLQHYNRGGAQHVNQNTIVRPLFLTERDQLDLIAFLESLTDPAFIQNSNYHDPF